MLALLVAAVAVPLVVPGVSRATRLAAHHRHLQVTGYVGDWSPPSVVDGQAHAVSIVGVDGVDVTVAGTDVPRPTQGALRLLSAAHADGVRAELLVANFAVPNDAPAVATRVLTSPRHRARIVRGLVRMVAAEGWDGVTVDLEELAPTDGVGLAHFVERLRSELPRRDLLAVDVTAAPSLAAYARLGYRLSALSKVADVVLMAYDQHGPWSGPGPIGGLPWQRACVDAALHDVPAARLVLGVPAYGYTWPAGARVQDGVTLSVVQARHQAAASHVRPRWDAPQGEWTVRLRDGTVIWWADSRSYRHRLRLAAIDHLAGVAVWQLASSDRLPPP